MLSVVLDSSRERIWATLSEPFLLGKIIGGVRAPCRISVGGEYRLAESSAFISGKTIRRDGARTPT
jgi:hypothetical protein